MDGNLAATDDAGWLVLGFGLLWTDFVCYAVGDQQTENYRSWIRKNSELTEFLRIQLRIVVVFILPIALRQVRHSNPDLAMLLKKFLHANLLAFQS